MGGKIDAKQQRLYFLDRHVERQGKARQLLPHQRQ